MKRVGQSLVPEPSKGEFMVPLFRSGAHMIEEVEDIVEQLRGELRSHRIKVFHVNPRRSSAEFDRLIIVPPTSNGRIDLELERQVRRRIDDVKQHVAARRRPTRPLLRRG